MPARQCAVDGCESVHYARGYCSLHYRRVRRAGTSAAAPTHCEVDGCRRRRYVRGLCQMHSARQRRHGDTGSVEATTGLHACQVPECTREAQARGYCRVHYSALRDGRLQEP